MCEVVKLGQCCGCENSADGGSIVMMPWKAEIPGHGWGCLECGLANDGATIVLCVGCAEKLECGMEIWDVAQRECRGFPETEGRRELSPLSPLHEHDMSRHFDHLEGLHSGG